MQETQFTLQQLAQADQKRRFGDFDAALTACEAALEKDPKSLATLQFLSTLHFTLEDYEKAAALLERFALLKPDSVDCWHGLGLAYEALGRLDEALSAYKAAVEVDPENPFSFLFLGRIEAALERPEAAQQAYQLAIKLNPDILNLLNNPDVPEQLKGYLRQAQAALDPGK